MSREWTDEQMMVLAERDNNLLVSAAAGSGKTAVMVERIIRLITEGENPPDIDRFLVVTFTRAAAASMRERIADALRKALDQDPGNIHIQKQTALVHQAQITTIHSFCQEVVRSHFFNLDIDPGFRVGDEGEMLLLKEEVMDELMEEAHDLAEGDPRIRAFFEYFTRKTLDSQAAQQIMRIYDYSCAYPWPDDFRASLTEAYRADDIRGLEDSAW
ncbi:MAG: UvrD-helicase domain-containing protein, partial [Lachnospiraceae bacterium]|nr:UvrD-helicase domain-containing protein [Lachnospiraceae bacterium]